MAFAYRLTIHFYLLQLLLGSVFSFIGTNNNYRRKVSLELNPGLNSSVTPPPGVGLVHVRARGTNDTLHFLLCSLGAPTLLLVHTNSSNSTLEIDWPNFLESNTTNSLRVAPEGSVQYSFALVFTRLWEYNDINDTADPDHLPPSSFFPPYQLQHFTWEDLNKTLNPESFTSRLCGRDGTKSFDNSSLCLELSGFESEGRDPGWPSLLHNANSTQLQFWLNGISPKSNQSRFSLELQAVTRTDPMGRVDVLRSIDDEYTPSIFQVAQWKSLPNNAVPVSGYSQWKPVAYRTASPIFKDATPCHHSDPVPMNHLPPSGLVMAYFELGSQTTGVNISFSIAGDPYYNTTNYLSWTVLVGLGSPPMDYFSPLVLAIMAVGLGTPILIILLGGLCVCVRRRELGAPVYQPIN